MLSNGVNANRRYSDPSALTAYETKIWDLYQQGKTAKEIAEEIGTKKASTVSCRLVVIKEKLGCAK